ncbi:hypothetical protein [Alkalimarinus alittae]|uniref:DUF4367 domain-containing protein n=1 Tax=Alkalimarinus alittae TaxID=2961619 RepID=A0ABY6N6K7_9ALTE|nr:hypothetical protein [Alkalimarinus alittae]UZE97731.1 hypothetical protein NKI27_08360 [Alkalimarinus alittae]
MGSWIVILIVLSLMGSVFWVMPSTRDRERMKVRQWAMGKGLKVRMPNKTLKERLVRYEDFILGAYIYECLNFSSQTVKFSGGLYVIKDKEGVWSFVEASLPQGIDKAAVLQAANSLPSACHLLMLSSSGALVFWDERGEEKDVNDIYVALNAINESMIVPKTA